MTSWMEERDRLIAQTQAFVQQVAAAHPVKAEVEMNPIRIEMVEAVAIALPAEPFEAPALPAALAEPAAPVATAQQILALRPVASERSQIMERVAAFRARQARLNDERDAWYQTMQSKIRNDLKTSDAGNEAEGSRL